MEKPKSGERWFVYLDHPRIGGGWRVVDIKRAGWKWVSCRTAGCQTNFRMMLKKWNLVNKRPMYLNEEGEWKALWNKIV